MWVCSDTMLGFGFSQEDAYKKITDKETNEEDDDELLVLDFIHQKQG